MVTIISPQSTYGDYNDSNEFLLEWSCDISGQSGYEIYYKLSSSSSWLSTGKVTSTDTTYDLSNIYTLLGVDFTEITYKVKIYYDTTNNEGALTGTEESDIYTIIFSQPVSGYLNVYDGEETDRYPLFSTIVKSDCDKFKVKKSDGVLSAPLVETTSPIASNFKIKVGNSNKALASSYANGLNYIVNNTPGEFDQSAVRTVNDNYYKGSYYVNSTYYTYYKYYYYYSDWNANYRYTRYVDYTSSKYYVTMYYKQIYQSYYYWTYYVYGFYGATYNHYKEYSVPVYYYYYTSLSTKYYGYVSYPINPYTRYVVNYYYFYNWSSKYSSNRVNNYSYYYYLTPYSYSQNYTYKYYT